MELFSQLLGSQQEGYHMKENYSFCFKVCVNVMFVMSQGYNGSGSLNRKVGQCWLMATGRKLGHHIKEKSWQSCQAPIIIFFMSF